MTSDREMKGQLYCRWVQDLLSGYAEDVEETAHGHAYDIEMKIAGKVHLVECKCYHVFHSQKKVRLGEMSFQRVQVNRLTALYPSVEKIWYVCGIELNPLDVYSVVLPFDEVLKQGARMKGRHYITVPMKLLFAQQPIRSWIAETFNQDPEWVVFPKINLSNLNAGQEGPLEEIYL